MYELLLKAFSNDLLNIHAHPLPWLVLQSPTLVGPFVPAGIDTVTRSFLGPKLSKTSA